MQLNDSSEETQKSSSQTASKEKSTGRRKQWIETGVIDQATVSEDGSNQSFIITLDKGGLSQKQTPHQAPDDNNAEPNPPYMNTRAVGTRNY